MGNKIVRSMVAAAQKACVRSAMQKVKKNLALPAGSTKIVHLISAKRRRVEKRARVVDRPRKKNTWRRRHKKRACGQQNKIVQSNNDFKSTRA